MSHGAQCMLCQHAKWRGRTVAGCLAFEEAALPEIAARALASLIYRQAGSAPCAIRSRLEIGPDAYLAEDLPVIDSPQDREDYAARGHLYADPGSDVHDFEPRP